MTTLQDLMLTTSAAISLAEDAQAEARQTINRLEAASKRINQRCKATLDKYQLL